MPAPLPPDQLTVIRTLLSKGDKAGAIKTFMEATGSTEAEATTEVNNLASRYGLVGAQLPDIFVRRTPPKPAAPSSETPPAPAAPPAPAPVAQQAANVPVEPAAPVPPPAPAPTAPPPSPAPAPVAAAQKPSVSPASQPTTSASTPSAQKSSRWGCSSLVVLLGGVTGFAWWAVS